MLKHITKSKTICKFSEKIDTNATIYIYLFYKSFRGQERSFLPWNCSLVWETKFKKW